MNVLWEFATLKEFENDSFYSKNNTIPGIDHIFFAEWDEVLTIDHSSGIVENLNGVKLKRIL